MITTTVPMIVIDIYDSILASLTVDGEGKSRFALYSRGLKTRQILDSDLCLFVGKDGNDTLSIYPRDDALDVILRGNTDLRCMDREGVETVALGSDGMTIADREGNARVDIGCSYPGGICVPRVILYDENGKATFVQIALSDPELNTEAMSLLSG